MKLITFIILAIVTLDVIYTYYYYSDFNSLYIASVYILSGIIFRLINEQNK